MFPRLIRWLLGANYLVGPLRRRVLESVLVGGEGILAGVFEQ